MKRAIITGATGFIGGWLARELIHAGYETTLIVRDAGRLLPELLSSPNSVVIQGELSALSADDFPFREYDTFFHLSWAGVAPEQKHNVSLQLSNIPMSLSALELSRKLNCGLFVSAGTAAGNVIIIAYSEGN